MDLKITDDVVAGFKDKDSKVPKFRGLYEEHDFITAYSKHTDMRMEADPQWAIGRGDEWESHGLLQLEYLKEYGLTPRHYLLDIGCGPGRAARRFVPYLEQGRYTGIDISPKCVEYAKDLAAKEGWDAKAPQFILNADVDLDFGPFDFVWAHSVFTHLPPDQIEKMVGNIRDVMRDGGRFLFTYKRNEKPRRSGLKQFQYPDSYFVEVARKFSLSATPLKAVFPAGQHTFLFEK